ncbi:fecR family protein [Bacteroides fragilis str. 3397 T10]|nr:fecR family protein [Bacteroides fragilis str. 3397 T10]
MVAVDYGQKANLTLPDGTKVWLNSATHLSYDAEYNKSDRKIYLDGEAYFEVAKNKDKRFIVCCNDLEIEALGTIFDVKGYGDDLSVTTLLAEGSVRVSNKREFEIKSKNSKLSVIDKI